MNDAIPSVLRRLLPVATAVAFASGCLATTDDEWSDEESSLRAAALDGPNAQDEVPLDDGFDGELEEEVEPQCQDYDKGGNCLWPWDGPTLIKVIELECEAAPAVDSTCASEAVPCHTVDPDLEQRCEVFTCEGVDEGDPMQICEGKVTVGGCTYSAEHCTDHV
ncbi:MAG: hypothetical protein K0V04_24260 [Deltaproteobacteria bacterium]|nr:hypothetical protein [Deltaproteobacteria bacterium]